MSLVIFIPFALTMSRETIDCSAPVSGQTLNLNEVPLSGRMTTDMVGVGALSQNGLVFERLIRTRFDLT